MSTNNSFSTTYDKSALERYGWKFDGITPITDESEKADEISRQRAKAILSRAKSKEDAARLHTKKLHTKKQHHAKI